MDDITWDTTHVDEEEFSENDMKDAESMGRVPPGKFLCTCIESKPRMVNLKEYSCVAANLKFRIDKVLELNGSPPDETEAESLEGKFIFDSVNLAHPSEKDGMRKRRLLIAKRLGLIGPSDTAISSEAWKESVIGNRVILLREQQDYKDKRTGVMKSSVRVAFSGYETPTGEDAKPEDYSDI